MVVEEDGENGGDDEEEEATSSPRCDLVPPFDFEMDVRKCVSGNNVVRGQENRCLCRYAVPFCFCLIYATSKIACIPS